MGRHAVDCPPKECAVCGQSFSRRRFGGRLEDRTRFQARRYCSKQCFGAACRQEEVCRDTHNRRAREAALRDACEVCGGSVRLSVHHIDEDWRNDDPENIQTLCSPCHSSHHMRARHAGRYPAGRATPESVGCLTPEGA